MHLNDFQLSPEFISNQENLNNRIPFTGLVFDDQRQLTTCFLPVPNLI
jgi:hypothetical protein